MFQIRGLALLRQLGNRLGKIDPASLVLIGFAVLYVLLDFSPSSYGLVLDWLGIPNPNLIGQARPIRSDEWAVITPLLQSSVNNNFQLINHTSPYQESFISSMPMPILDWGLTFKPYFWAYFVLPSHVAYSLMWAIYGLAFVWGYKNIFIKFGLNNWLSALLALTLFFTPSIQFWWTAQPITFSLFPWVLLAALATGNKLQRHFVYIWVMTSWLMGFYPPFFIPLLFVGFITYLVLNLENKFSWRQTTYLVVGSALATLTTLFYLRDYIRDALGTVYPGSRRWEGGEGSFAQFLTQFSPTSTFDTNFNPIIWSNICENAVTGTVLFLSLFSFVNYKETIRKTKFSGVLRKKFLVPIVGYSLMIAWLFIPSGTQFGKIFLWNFTTPQRFLVVTGILLFIICAITLKEADFKFSLERTIIIGLILIIFWLRFKLRTDGFNKFFETSEFWTLLLLFAAAATFVLLRKHGKVILVAHATLCGLLFVGTFNPLQPSSPIFAHKNSRLIQTMADAENRNHGTLVEQFLPGAVQNGLGFKSIPHVLSVPEMSYWRKLFPNLPDSELNNLFNRYAHISTGEVNTPILIAPDSVQIPISAFTKGKL